MQTMRVDIIEGGVDLAFMIFESNCLDVENAASGKLGVESASAILYSLVFAFLFEMVGA